jgi:hypothetical protein
VGLAERDSLKEQSSYLRTLVDLKGNSEEAVKKITAETLLRVSRNVCKRVNLFLQENGAHFQHLL